MACSVSRKRRHKRQCAPKPGATLGVGFRVAAWTAKRAWSISSFFIATANDRGECDCSFRGREFNAAGQPYPLLKVLDAKTLVFPDFSGNKLYNSLGNILVNPHIGMLFVDFQNRSRARVNGAAEIIEDRLTHGDIWPMAQRYVQVTVQQAYPNCKARIPKMNFAPLTDAFFDE
jgi:predicted pyridoxine 5'-phosphate oxidase superfamily flavin-nucleotide-binding protein